MTEPLEPGWAEGLKLHDTPQGVTIPVRVQAERDPAVGRRPILKRLEQEPELPFGFPLANP